jgi:hypothetical protein
MRLVDRLLWAEGDHARIAATVRSEWPLCGPQGVPPLALVEAVAQAAGLLMGQRKSHERMGGRGWLVGIKQASLAPGPVPVGTTLELDVEILHEVDQYVVFRGRALDGEQVLAEVEIQTFQPAEMAAYMGEEREA